MFLLVRESISLFGSFSWKGLMHDPHARLELVECKMKVCSESLL
jgi:hypothetical protein